MSYNTRANLYASGNSPGIIRTNSNDPYANSVLSGKVNTNVGGVVVNPSVTTVPYNTSSGVYSPGVATNYVAAVPNRGTQEVRQTVTTTAPNYTHEQQLRMTRGQNSGNYEVRTVETRPAAYTNTTSYQTPVVTTNTNYHAPMVASGINTAPVVASRGPAPAVVQTRYTQQNVPATYEHREEKPSWWFKPLLALIGLLALAGIILGLLFGLGVIGGNKNVFDRGTDSTARGTLIDGVDYSNYTITKQTTVLNNSGTATTTTTTSTTPTTTTTTPITTTPITTTPTTTSTTSSTTYSVPTTVAPTVTTPTATTTTTTSTTSTTTVPATTTPTTVATSGNIRGSTSVEPLVVQPIVMPSSVVSPVAA